MQSPPDQSTLIQFNAPLVKRLFKCFGLLALLAYYDCTSADVFRCRLDGGELLYTDLGCLNADIEKQYKDMSRRQTRTTPAYPKRKEYVRPKQTSQQKHANASPDLIEARVRQNGFINYDHYDRSLANCTSLQPQTDLWLNNRCDAALEISKLELRQHGIWPVKVSVTTRESVDLSQYQHLDTSRSSTVRGVWFREDENHMVIKVNAGYYAYCGVARPIVMQLVLAPSISAYLHSHIKGIYDC